MQQQTFSFVIASNPSCTYDFKLVLIYSKNILLFQMGEKKFHYASINYCIPDQQMEMEINLLGSQVHHSLTT